MATELLERVVGADRAYDESQSDGGNEEVRRCNHGWDREGGLTSVVEVFRALGDCTVFSVVLLNAGVLVTGRRGDSCRAGGCSRCAHAAVLSLAGRKEQQSLRRQGRTAGYEGSGRREADSMVFARAGRQAGRQEGRQGRLVASDLRPS
jgi:hypothetical protein